MNIQEIYEIYEQLQPTFTRERKEQKTYHIDNRDALAQEAYEQGVLLQKNGHNDEALVAYELADALFLEYNQNNKERYAQFKDKSGDCRFKMAYIYLVTGDKPRALRNYEIALGLKPELMARFTENTLNTFKANYPVFFSEVIAPTINYMIKDLTEKLKRPLGPTTVNAGEDRNTSNEKRARTIVVSDSDDEDTTPSLSTSPFILLPMSETSSSASSFNPGKVTPRKP